MLLENCDNLVLYCLNICKNICKKYYIWKADLLQSFLQLRDNYAKL